jgi:hypothetical protein
MGARLEESTMLTPDEHRRMLRVFEVDRLLKLLELDAQKSHDGYYAILRYHSGFKVAFGIVDLQHPGCVPSKGYMQVAEMQHFPTLKDAIIEALVSGKEFTDYFDGDPVAWVNRERDPVLERQLLALSGATSRSAPSPWSERDESAYTWLRDWFFAHYEDPVEICPYESAEGGYQYLWGGPYDTEWEINGTWWGVFSEEFLTKVAARIEEEYGCTEWSGVVVDDKDR